MSDEPFPYAEYRDNNNKPLVKKHKTCSPLEGKSARQIVVEHMKREGISMTTAYRDWNQVLAWIDEDWKKDRESMMARLQAMRMDLFHTAVKRGQLQTASQILDSLGRVVGESTPEQISVNVPSLNIQIEPKSPPAQLQPSTAPVFEEPIEVDVSELELEQVSNED
jgi:hypothetical protein